MARITLHGNPINTLGDLPGLGDEAPDFILTKTDLTDATRADFSGKRIILNIFPSIDTPVCAMSVRKFNESAGKAAGIVVICVSRDLPFAHARFCGAEGLENVISVSELRNLDFGEDYGVRIVDGPMAGLLARAVLVLDENHKVIHRQLVPEIREEPDYDAVWQSIQS